MLRSAFKNLVTHLHQPCLNPNFLLNPTTLLTRFHKRCFASDRTLIKNGTIINVDEQFPADILVENGKISKIFRNGEIPPLNCKNVINANRNFIIPGGIDSHTHLQSPFLDMNTMDDFKIGSRAAISGGTTCFLDFVIPQKNESLLKAFDKWKTKADADSSCDYSLHLVLTSWNDQMKKEMGEIVKRGVTSFKFFLAYKNALMLSDTEFLKSLERCKELGALGMVHAENGDLISENQKKLLELGITGPEGHYLSRPEIVESEATRRAITIAECLNSPLYVVHAMTKLSVEEIKKGRARGNILFGEALAAGLGTDGTALWSKNWTKAAGYVMSPPLSPDPSTKEYLMKMLQNGVLQTVGTDNCTFSTKQKEIGKKDFTKIPNGINGIEDRMSIVWTNGVKKGLLSPSDFVKVTSTNSAKIFNLFPNKGVIREGADADIVIWNGEKERIISSSTHNHGVDFNIFEGMRVKGVAEMTMVRGNVMYQNGKYTENLKPGYGKFIYRKPYGYVYERMKELDKARDPRNFKVDRNVDQDKDKNINENELQKENTRLQKEISILIEENNKLKTTLEKVKNENENNLFDENNQVISLEKCIESFHKPQVVKEMKRLLYGKGIEEINLAPASIELSAKHNFEIKAYKIPTPMEEIRGNRIIRIGAIQNQISLPTTEPVSKQKNALIEKISNMITAAHHSGVNVICMQECWTAPFFMCTREKYPWLEFSESAINGESTKALQKLAKKYGMVIISPILERDDVKEVLWNSAVVIDNHGDILGKAHKMHIPRVGDFNESSYYMEGETGNPVFETEFGKIGINICYGRHHPLHWQALGINGAEIVFNPSATVDGLSEHLWFIEARNAAIANNYFSVAINRIGTEEYPNEFTSGDGKPSKKKFGHFYGSSYVTAPDGSRTPGLSRVRDGLLITEVDLNMCRQIKDKWGYQMTGRHSMYAELLKKYSDGKYVQEIIKKKF